MTLATDPDLVRLIAGIGYLVRYPIGCTEQRIALASGELALLPFTPIVDAAGLARSAGRRHRGDHRRDQADHRR